MPIFPKDYKLILVDAKSKSIDTALGLSDGDVVDVQKQLDDHLSKISDLKTNAEVIIYMQNEMSHYLLAYMSARTLAHSRASFMHGFYGKSSGFIDIIKLIDDLKSHISKPKSSTKPNAKSNDDIDDECKDCEHKDDCPDFLKELHRRAGE